MAQISVKAIDLRDELDHLKEVATKLQETWNYPNEHYIEATGVLMAIDDINEYLTQK